MKEVRHIVTTTCAIEKDGKFLVVQRSPDEIENPLKWVLPGGKVEEHENPLKAILREIKEEVNIEIQEEMAIIRVFNFKRKDDTNCICIVFAAKFKSGVVSLDDDLTDYKWVDINEYSQLNIVKGSEIHLKNARSAINNNLLVNKNILGNLE